MLLSRIIDFLSLRKKRASKKTLAEEIENIPLGEVVSLVFRDPRTMGVRDPSNRLTRRYDPEDLDTRKLTGVLTNKQVINGVMLLELAVNKITRDKGKRERLYTLMIDEIEHIKVLS